GIATTLSSNQIYVFGGINSVGVDQSTVFEFTPANNTAAGTPGTPTGAWVTRANLATARRQLGAVVPAGVTNFLPRANTGRDSRQDAIATWIQDKVRPA